MDLPPLVWIICAGMSLVAFLTFGWDKIAARRGGRRIPEATLHLLSLLGGWPGAVLAIVLLRHKTRKAGFLVVQTGVVLLYMAVGWWLRRSIAD